ncbi:hypothetical protein T12_8084 [Trichinella patagoniensis]|uniref:Uncharacterized protein n=1 Tax=Trichinella patagoniensis TaxID=990121 RepID=A0A0V0Z1S1_9BILA|nr:hypothetical protein T12_8084 [Trichinella patagoniensis]
MTTSKNVEQSKHVESGKSDERHQAEKLLKLLQIHSAVDIALFDVIKCASFVWDNNLLSTSTKGVGSTTNITS